MTSNCEMQDVHTDSVLLNSSGGKEGTKPKPCGSCDGKGLFR